MHVGRGFLGEWYGSFGAALFVGHAHGFQYDLQWGLAFSEGSYREFLSQLPLGRVLRLGTACTLPCTTSGCHIEFL